MNSRQRRGYWRVLGRYMKKHDPKPTMSMHTIQVYEAAEVVAATTMWKRVRR